MLTSRWIRCIVALLEDVLTSAAPVALDWVVQLHLMISLLLIKAA